MRASLSVRLLLLLAAGITQVQSLQIDVPSEWQRRCDIPVTITLHELFRDAHRYGSDPSNGAFRYRFSGSFQC
ncbi:hypothetical protein GGU11DRAFT_505607 [Lentinula aff. detonsa]|nr:hypothetical protein GGU11DRAFT_505607 [Lentinula aff. detonsa]